jgi:hypothetical protein
LSGQANRAKWSKLVKFPERQNENFFCFQGASCDKYRMAWVVLGIQVVAAVMLLLISLFMKWQPRKGPDNIRAQVSGCKGLGVGG